MRDQEVLFILCEDGKTPKSASAEEFSKWFSANERKLKITKFENHRVSTFFLGIDHNFSGLGPPFLWETMIFKNDGYVDIYLERYSSYEEALLGHEKACEFLKDYLA